MVIWLHFMCQCVDLVILEGLIVNFFETITKGRDDKREVYVITVANDSL